MSQRITTEQPLGYQTEGREEGAKMRGQFRVAMNGFGHVWSEIMA
jgi:hypothetical protein